MYAALRVLFREVVLPAATLCAIPAAAHAAPVSPDEQPSPVVSTFVAYVNEHADGKTAYSFDKSIYRNETRDLPIGVFDSGIGGLTVLEAIFALDQFHNDTLRPGPDGRRDFENERFIYLGDQANMPYGNYGTVGRQDFLRELILKDATFLLGRRYWHSETAPAASHDKPPVKAIVIACNTATAFGLQDLREAIRLWEIPVIVVGVVEAGARGVTEIASEYRPENPGTIAVLATVGTCGTMAYPKSIASSLGLAGRRVPLVIQQGSLGLAGAIEGDPSFVVVGQTASVIPSYQGPGISHPTAPLNVNEMNRYGFTADGLLGNLQQPETLRLNSVANYINYDVTTLVENYRQSGQTQPIDTVVLGCTHFPLAQQEILEAFARLRSHTERGTQPYRELISEKIHVVNPAELTAKELFRSLASAKLRRTTQDSPSTTGDLFFISVANPQSPGIRLNADGGLDRDYKYGREAGRLDLEDTRTIPMTPQQLPEPSLNLIRSRLPEVWRRLNRAE